MNARPLFDMNGSSEKAMLRIESLVLDADPYHG